ncbi:diguanylate cyclase (GGDEF) domain-containing protein [Cupriavidus sp. OV038]|jgi:diguanylate cyclase (GGDEF)-like protein|uniref:GGDEF domain-containing protein n=1 Tax=unclassified Cupriavidus TaxID=2640874 RepID=UPI0008E7F71F|nr:MULTISPECIES: sensor domain-containing diguanylate cyclase [unclassified Cupriavidus]SFC18478.1 diguanylate cyclase (GGDEF) domain-containing protein [Cupriavidus sp. OV038]SFP13562.1 diguanylate cyclase (GGDEF) domain-containing protein [Cupriavidus sp. OV096]
MQPPPIPPDETLRLATLRSLNILDTPAEERFDRLTRLAKRLFDVPIAVVSLVDANRQWFKACEGLDQTEAPRNTSFCGHAIAGDGILLIPDARLDPRFHDNPLVTGDPHIRFYAGCPLVAHNGTKLGTLCLIDRQPRTFDDDDRALLHDLARMAEQELAAVHLASMDELTALSNRRGFTVLSQHAIELCRRLDRPATLVFFDMDGFKPINDQFGHAEGDRALTAFGAALRQAFRDSDVVGRLGGDEFAALLTNTDAAGCGEALARLHRNVDAWNAQNARGYRLRFSVGLTEFDPSRHATVHELLAQADAAMYADKAQRKATRH